MNKFIPKILSVATFILILASCTKYIYVYRSAWQDSPVAADGKAYEWPATLKYYDVKSKLQYSVTNDNENLYVCIKAAEEETQRKIYRAGLQLWIDTTGNNEHKTGIMFPLSGDIRHGDMPSTPRKTTEADGSKKKFFNDFIEMELVGFHPPMNGMTSVQNAYGISASMNKDSVGIMTYEAVIPFKTFYKDALTASDSLKLFGISIVLKAVPTGEAEGHKGNAGVRGGGGSMGGGGMSGGGMGGGGMRGGGGGGSHGGGGHRSGGEGASQGSEYLFESNYIKKIFQLAVKKK